MKGRASLVLAMLLLMGGPASLRSAEPTASELARALQAKYDTIRDFAADFVHTYRGGVLKKSLTERGHMLVKKPGKMRWEYTSPEKKTFVSDGVKLYSYIPADKQVIVSSIPEGDTATTPALFLAGKGDLTRDFEVSDGETPAGAPPGTRALKLVPKTPQPDYDWLLLLVDPVSLTLRGLVTVDPQGGTSSLSFSNLLDNVGLSDKEFTFSVPRGVDVVSDAGPR
jgi:outer membrane lipoprotein carrier protein